MEKKKLPQITRQLRTFFIIWASEEYLSPRELMRLTGMKNRMMLKRDLDDIRDSGLCNARYMDSKNGGIYIVEPSEFCENAGERKKAHLRHLNRLGNFLTDLKPVDPYMLMDYKEGLTGYEETAEALRSIDVIAKYRELYPDIGERTRQRDLAVINAAGQIGEEELDFRLYCPRGFKTLVFKCEAPIYERL